MPCFVIYSYSEIKITLWGQRAAAFSTDGIYDRALAKPITVLFVGGLMKSYQGTWCLFPCVLTFQILSVFFSTKINK